MKRAEMRKIALGAARSRMRAQQIDPMAVNADSALRVLDDSYRIDPETIAALWYGQASDNQIALFKKEWKQWQVLHRSMN